MANRFISVIQNVGWRVFAKGALLISALLALGFFGKSVDMEGLFKSFAFSADAPDILHGPTGFVLLATALLSVSCPRQVVSFFAAYFFGLWIGFGLALLSTVLSCIVIFTFARLFKARLEGVIRGRLNIAVQFWKDNVFLTAVIWRFLPLGSNFLTNLSAGALGISAPAFITGSAIGYIPQTLIFSVMGSGVDVESGLRIAISIALFAVSTVLGLMLYGRYRKSLKRSS